MTERMNDARIAEIEKREKAATRGPWEYHWEEDGSISIRHNKYHYVAVRIDERCVDFVAHSRTDVPDLIAELRRTRKSEKRKANLMQEAMDNCPTCRSEMDNDRRCAMCKTFLAELKPKPEVQHD